MFLLNFSMKFFYHRFPFYNNLTILSVYFIFIYFSGQNYFYKELTCKRISSIIPPYIRMLSSDWLMKGVFFYQFFVFSAFPLLPGYLHKNIPVQLKSRLAKILIFRSVEYLKIQGR